MTDATKEERDNLRLTAEDEYNSISGGECYVTVHFQSLMNLLDDADRCAELEVLVQCLRDGNLALVDTIARIGAERGKATTKVSEIEHILNQSNDALREARLALGDDDRPFICDAIRELQNERNQLRNLIARRNNIPTYCHNCCLENGKSPWVEWDGSTLRCPNCGIDALQH